MPSLNIFQCIVARSPTDIASFICCLDDLVSIEAGLRRKNVIKRCQVKRPPLYIGIYSGTAFVRTVERAGLPSTVAVSALEEAANGSEAALMKLKTSFLPIPEKIAVSVQHDLKNRLTRLT